MMTSKITIPVPVDERFFSINVQKNRIEHNIFTTLYRKSDTGASLLNKINNKICPIVRTKVRIS